MRLFSLVAALLVLVLTAAPALAVEQKGAAGAAGGVGAAPGLSEEQLGPCRWVIEGEATDVKPDQNKIVVSTDMGNQPLDVTAESTIRDAKAKDIALSDIKPGDRVVVSFHRKDGKSIVGYLYQLPKKGPMAAPGAESPHGGTMGQ